MGRQLTDADRSRIDTAVRRAADAIIEGKGATWFGVGAALARIAQAIEDNERALLTCSMLTQECQGVRDVAFSLRDRRERRREDLGARSRRWRARGTEAGRRNTEGGGTRGALLESQG
jgi:lactate/malate dehydrogenase, alpha/beta C-terminal domain